MTMERVTLLGLAALIGCKDGGEAIDSGATGTATTETEVICDKTWNNRTVGLLHCSPDASPGYTLFAPIQYTETYLIDIEGKLVNSWSSDYVAGESVYLEPNGHLLRSAEDSSGTPFITGGSAGRVEEFDWDGNLVWSFTYKSDSHLSHHDVERLPSGNVLMIAWELKTEAEAIAADIERLVREAGKR